MTSDAIQLPDVPGIHGSVDPRFEVQVFSGARFVEPVKSPSGGNALTRG